MKLFQIDSSARLGSIAPELTVEFTEEVPLHDPTFDKSLDGPLETIWQQRLKTKNFSGWSINL